MGQTEETEVVPIESPDEMTDADFHEPKSIMETEVDAILDELEIAIKLRPKTFTLGDESSKS